MSSVPKTVAAAVARSKQSRERENNRLKALARIQAMSAPASSSADADSAANAASAAAEAARVAKLSQSAKEAEATEAEYVAAGLPTPITIYDRDGRPLFMSRPYEDVYDSAGKLLIRGSKNEPIASTVQPPAPQAPQSPRAGRPKINKPPQLPMYTIENIHEKPKPEKKATAADPCHAITNVGKQCKNKKFEGEFCKIHARFAPKSTIGAPQDVATMSEHLHPDNIAPEPARLDVNSTNSILSILNEGSGVSPTLGTSSAGVVDKLNAPATA